MIPQVRLANESEMPVVNYADPPAFDRRDYYGFRNAVISILRDYGTAGPEGLADLDTPEEDSMDFLDWIREPMDFFVVSDMWNRHDRLCLVECSVDVMRLEMLERLVGAAAAWPGWHVAFNMDDCGLRVFGDKVVAGGRRFWDCTNLVEVVERCQGPVDYGKAELADDMYPLWRAVITGTLSTLADFAPPQNQEWKEAIRSLDALCSRIEERPLRSTSYDRIRYDLHPETRRRFMAKFLAEIEEMGAVAREALRSATVDVADILRDGDSETKIEWIDRWSRAQDNMSSWASPSELIFWWPYLIDGMAKPVAPDLRDRLDPVLRKKASAENPWIRLSALHALAILGAPDIDVLVAAARTGVVEYSKRPEIMAWLDRLQAGQAGYPSLGDFG